MTGQELKRFVEVGLDCGSQDEVFFYQNLNVLKNFIEGLRDWRILERKKEFSSVIVNDKSEINFPSSLKTIKNIRDKNDNLIKFYLDFENNKIILDGKYDSVILTYLIFSPEITSTTSWIFPENFHQILGYLYADVYKSGVDFDAINLNNALRLNKQFKDFILVLFRWDDDLKYYEMQGNFDLDKKYYNEFGLPL